MGKAPWRSRRMGRSPGAHGPLLAVEQVNALHRSRRRDRWILHDVSFELDVAENVAVVGPGTGLRTLGRIASGEIQPDTGVVRLHGVELSTATHEVRRRVAVARRSFQALPEDRSTVEHVALALLPFGLPPHERISDASRSAIRLGLAPDAPLGDLADHELTLAALARALVTEPDLVIVDDPAFGCNAAQRRRMARLLSEIASSGTAILSFTADADATAGARLMDLTNAELVGQLTPPAGAEVHRLADRRTGNPQQAGEG